MKPTTIQELRKIIDETIEKEGFEWDLNFIDVSNIRNMSKLFWNSQFNGDISKWGITNARELDYMFDESQFDQDLSNWRCQI